MKLISNRIMWTVEVWFTWFTIMGVFLLGFGYMTNERIDFWFLKHLTAWALIAMITVVARGTVYGIEEVSG